MSSSKNPSCEYCGRCLSVCPSYKHFLVETMSPRARIDLARAVEKGEFTPSLRYAESLSGCLQCLACTAICGKGVDGAQVILGARLAQHERSKIQNTSIPLARRVEEWVTTILLPRRSLLTKVVHCMALFQKLFCMEPCGTVRHLPDVLTLGAGQRSMPVLSSQSLFDHLPEVVPAKGKYVGEVAIFSGCFGGVVNPTAALNLVERLRNLGFTVHVPRAQGCCGAPALLSGFGRALQHVQHGNTEVFAKLHMPILTLCATCHRTLTCEYGETEWSERIVDSAVFLQQHESNASKRKDALPLSVPSWLMPEGQKSYSVDNPLRVAVHDPCHLRLNPNAGQALRQALAARPWIEVVSIPDAGACCGGGGISSLKNPELADQLGAARAAAVLSTNAQVVVAQCPGCVLQLNNHLVRASDKGEHGVRACHALELIA